MVWQLQAGTNMTCACARNSRQGLGVESWFASCAVQFRLVKANTGKLSWILSQWEQVGDVVCWGCSVRATVVYSGFESMLHQTVT